MPLVRAIAAAALALALISARVPARSTVTLLNVSYDPTRELYRNSSISSN